MADTKSIDIKLLKHTHISVQVEEALPDLLVVSYALGVKIYKGVLLESTKRNLPCGITSLHPAFTKTEAEDPLFAVNQRFAYVEPKAAHGKKNVFIGAGKHKHSKMTVRLRPRQVLCSKCKGICNENSENVGRKRKSVDGDSQVVPAKRGANAPVTRASVAENKVRFELRSRQTLLSPPQGGNDSEVDSVKVLSVSVTPSADQAVVVPKKSDLRSARRTLRRKPAEEVQTLADNNDEGKNNNVRSQSNANSSSVVNEISSSNSNSSSSTCSSSTRTIKICYGPQGEGTVLKIPAQIDNLHGNSTDEKEIDVLNEAPAEVDPIGHSSSSCSDRATRKALKKAKKEARKHPSTPPFTNIAASTSIIAKSQAIVSSIHQQYHQQEQMPCATAGAVSPARYTLGADVGGNVSPKHGSGCSATPRAVVEGASAGDKSDIPEQQSIRRRKHKVKHKKRHREDRERKTNVDNDDDTSQCSTQKLSINLKRLNDTYCATTIPFLPIDESSASSDELIPDFPPNEEDTRSSNVPLSNTTKDTHGSVVCTGDVVWGKMQGFPWWPAKVLSINDRPITDVNEDTSSSSVHVSWYGSELISLLTSHQLCNYLSNYKIRYNKRKRGPYKAATRLATIEARLNADRQPIITPFLPTNDIDNSTASLQQQFNSYPETTTTTTTTTEVSPLLTTVRPALASPREINVIS